MGAVLELYEYGLRWIGHLKLYKPYLVAIDKEISYLKEFRITELSLFSREDGQSNITNMWPNSKYIVEIDQLRELLYFQTQVIP